MIQIDDAGWGSLVGGVVVGVYRTTTGEFTHGVVAPRFFQGAAFAGKEYLDQMARSGAGVQGAEAQRTEVLVSIVLWY